MTTEAVNNNLNILIDPTFTNVNRLFVLAYQNADDRQSFSQFYLPNVMVKDYNVMQNQKIINLLDKVDTDSKHFATKKWYIINDENNTNYGVNIDTVTDNPDTIKYDARVLKPNLCDYAEAYILVDGTIRATNAVNATRLALKNCAPFTKCNLEINDEHVDTAENLDIVMPMYNLIKYSDNYQDSSTTLYQYKRDEPPEDDAVADLTADNSDFLKYKIK